ncbi:YfzA family protein [Lysinibacillus sp. NPDC094403]|uniref:YfzA family protein n=1 Tax=Lysinibacillus sp. NPDC094403 TaxID=3390581 RepID=UPI003CFD2F5D
MANKQNQIPFLKRPWVSSIGVFVLSQIIFITCETTGWIPNYRDISGTLFGRITDSSIFREWFTFYETQHFNLLTLFFGIVFLVPGIIGAIKNVVLPKSINTGH